jgi:thiol-disulfide isomerase/thioredoxin
MRSFSILILILFFYSAQCLGQPVEVHGRIANFPADAEAAMAMAGINNFLNGQDQIRTEIQPDGTFALNFELDHPQDIFLRIGGFGFSLLLAPGEELELNWDYSADRDEDPASFVRFSGANAERHRHFSHMMYQSQKEVDTRMGENIQSLAPADFLALRFEKKTEQEAFFKEYLRENGIQDVLLSKWIDYYTAYQTANDLVAYPIMHAQMNRKRPRELDLPENYYDYIEEIKINDKEAMICSRYIMFIHRDYYIYLRQQSQLQPGYRESVEQDRMVAFMYEYLQDHSDGLAREVVLTRFLLEMMEMQSRFSGQIPALMEDYYNLVKEKSFRDAVLEKYQLVFDEQNDIQPAEHVSLLDFEAEETSVLPSLARQFAGKVIYIDIWATWCGPCIAEMNYYPKLIEHYRDQEVVFVFLAAHSPENLWKMRINEYGLEGKHHRLNEKQYYALEEYFELRGFPQHVIVNREGEVVDPRGRGSMMWKGI